jgi:hypothetical protein
LRKQLGIASSLQSLAYPYAQALRLEPLHFVQGLLETWALLWVYTVKGALQCTKQHLEHYRVCVQDAATLLLAKELLERKGELVDVIR